jgi:hypothetical protein
MNQRNQVIPQPASPAGGLAECHKTEMKHHRYAEKSWHGGERSSQKDFVNFTARRPS